MEFLIKHRKGTTKRFFAHAEKHQSLPTSMTDMPASSKVVALIDGPYGHMRPLRQFDSILLMAGGSGSTFTTPLMREIVARWKTEKSSTWNIPGGAATKYVRFIWVIKSREQYHWFADQLAAVAEDLARLRKENNDVAAEMSVYITCDTSLTGERGRTATEPPLMSPQAQPLEKEEGKVPAVTVELISNKAWLPKPMNQKERAAAPKQSKMKMKRANLLRGASAAAISRHRTFETQVLVPCPTPAPNPLLPCNLWKNHRLSQLFILQ